jgi:hypothetical protein
MIETMEDQGRTLTETDIEQLESQIEKPLPIDYKTFLLKYNGGCPTPNAFPIEGLANNPFGTIQVFFRVGGHIESSNIDWNCEVYNGRLPDNLLPIACDDGGDLICISIYGKDAGAVVFWDAHQETNEPTYNNVYPIADSFSRFIMSIQELQL